MKQRGIQNLSETKCCVCMKNKNSVEELMAHFCYMLSQKYFILKAFRFLAHT